MATLTGKTLGKYEVFERIGRGGMADVYKGRHERLDRTVAIKVLHPFLAEGDDFLARFEREARAVASLRHPHIVQVYDFDAEDDDLYMVMEYIGGGSLKDRLQKAAAEGRFLPLETVKSILGQVSDALDAAHAKGMLHRDVKPANVLLDESGRAFLADFGIARIVSTTQFTATGSLVGTPAYMSPEQARGESLTPASDLYALGVILYEMLSNTLPFDADTPLAIIHKQIHDPLPSIRATRAELPEGVVSVLERALAKEPGARYASAGALADAFREALDGAGREIASVGGDYKPTVVMEPEPEGTDYKETVAMDSDAPLEKTDGAKREPEPLPGSAARGKAESVPAGEAPVKRSVPPLLIGGVVLVALVVIAALSGLFAPAGGGCDSIMTCREAAGQAEAEGQFEASLRFLEEAASMVPESDQPGFADIWCQYGHINLRLDRPDDAIGSFERCMDWTHGLPEFEGLRMEADQMINELSGN